MDLSQLETFDDLSREAVDTIRNYRAFIESTKVEVAIINKVFNALLLSRTGFVFQEIKDLEYEVINEIVNRIAEVNSTECIDAANEQLAAASLIAGTATQNVYQDIIEQIELAKLLKVYPTLTELSWLTSGFAVESLSLIAFFNPLTDFNQTVDNFAREVATVTELFEAFVDEIILEMTSLVNLHRSLSGNLFMSLDETRLEFLNSVSNIRRLLIDECE